MGGGELRVDESEQSGVIALEPVFQLELAALEEQQCGGGEALANISGRAVENIPGAT